MFAVAGGILLALGAIAILNRLPQIALVLLVLWAIGHFAGH